MNKPTRSGALVAIIGGAATALSGVLVQAVVQPASTVPDTMWSYPWSADAIVPVSIVYALFHLIVFAGLLGFARSGVAGRLGPRLTLAGTALLLVAELASIPLRHQRLDDTGPAVVGGVFGLAILLGAVGFLVAGVVTLRAGVWSGWRRFVPLSEGIWMVALIGVSLTNALPTGVGIYGALILLLGVALYPRSATTPSSHRQLATRATVVS